MPELYCNRIFAPEVRYMDIAIDNTSSFNKRFASVMDRIITSKGSVPSVSLVLHTSKVKQNDLVGILDEKASKCQFGIKKNIWMYKSVVITIKNLDAII